MKQNQRKNSFLSIFCGSQAQDRLKHRITKRQARNIAPRPPFALRPGLLCILSLCLWGFQPVSAQAKSLAQPRFRAQNPPGQTQRWQLPHYDIEHDASGLRVYALQAGVREAFPLWEVPTQFLEYAHGGFAHHENRGSFRIWPRITSKCSTQSWEHFVKKDNSLEIRGQLKGPDLCQSLYSLKFSEQDHMLQVSLQSVLEQAEPDPRFAAEHKSSGLLTLKLKRAHHLPYWGLGEQFSHLDLRGKQFPMIVQEGGIGRGQQPLSSLIEAVSPGSAGHASSSYFPLPFLWNSRNQALLLKNRGLSHFDLRPPGELQIQVEGNAMHLSLFQAESPLALLTQFHKRHPAFPQLPDWVHRGAIIGIQGGSQRVQKIWEQLRQAQVPITAFWLQDWVGKRKTAIGSQLWWNWEINRAHYPQWHQLRQEWARADIRVMGYINPFLVDARPLKPRRNLYSEALKAGYLVRNHKGQTYPVKNTDFAAGLVDMSKPQARQWLQKVIQEQLINEAGLSGWMADYAEALPLDAHIFDLKMYQQQIGAAHNDYPRLWAEVNAQAIQTSGCQDCVFFMRSGYLGSVAHSPLFWTGDQMVDWDADDGMGSALIALLSSGLSGIPINHTDIGGYTSVVQPLLQPGWRRSPELLQRWSEMAAFTAIFRSHEGNQPEVNAQIYDSPERIQAFAQQAKIFAALFPYRQRLFAEAQHKGWPVVRHPLLHYPYDAQVLKLTDQFMLGEALMIAPILKPDQRQRQVYLPAGQWKHLWSGQIMGEVGRGSWINVPAPLGQTPVFYRPGNPVGQRLSRQLNLP